MFRHITNALDDDDEPRRQRDYKSQENVERKKTHSNMLTVEKVTPDQVDPELAVFSLKVAENVDEV